MFQVVNSNSLSIVTELVNEMSQLFAADFADAKGEAGLKMVEDIASGLTLVADAVSVQIAAAGARATALRAEVQEEALARVVLLLNSGSITLADITSRLVGAAAVEPAVFALPVAQVVAEVVAAVAIVEAATAVEAVVVAQAPAPVEAQTVEVIAKAPVAGVLVPTQALTAPYKNAVKFFDPASGAGWSGRGPMPKWFSDLLVNGKTKEDFRVVAQAPTTPAAVVEAPAAIQSESAAAVEAAPVPEPVTPIIAADIAADIGTDIGADVSFDANFDFDEVTAPAKRDDDIGEFIIEFAAMNPLPLVAQLIAA